jgi:hypothetical protein
MKQVFALIFLGLFHLSYCCMNDRDTLGFELRNIPDAQRALTGRFDRFPALYYEMRIARLNINSSLKPSEIDDLAVAYERIGKTNEAISTIERKKTLTKLTDMDWYSFYANRGTFRAHLWIKNRGLEPLATLEGARDDIETAIKKNSNAHFGREGVQLEVIKWIISVEKGRHIRLGEFLIVDNAHSQKGYEESLVRLNGLYGLITLGAAWDSLDTALAIVFISRKLNQEGPTKLATERAMELIVNGKKTLYDPPQIAYPDVAELKKSIPLQSMQNLAHKHYVELRAEADDWIAKRNDFMMTKLKLGNHPDTDADFWQGYVDTPMPKLPTMLPFFERPTTRMYASFAVAFLVLVVVGYIAFRVLRWLAEVWSRPII